MKHLKNHKISITTLLYRSSPKLLLLSITAGAAAGSLYGLIIPLVLYGVNNKNSIKTDTTTDGYILNFISQNFPFIFISLCVVIMLMKLASIIIVNNIAKTATAELKITIAKKIQRMLVAHVEKEGLTRLLNIIGADAQAVANAATAIPMLLVSVLTIFGMLFYLATLNIYVFFIILIAILVGAIVFQIPSNISMRFYEQARELQDISQEGIRGLIFGVYELKLDHTKADKFMQQELVNPMHKALRIEKLGDALLHTAGNFSDLLAFLIIGLVIFFLPNSINLAPTQSYGVIMALLYVAGPVGHILSTIQNLQRGKVALARIHILQDLDEEILSPTASSISKWTSFNVKNATYVYPKQHENEETPFSLAETSLSFQKGKIYFIVGGNGSGKSTLSKLISLHYIPTTGSVSFDETIINSDNIVSARSKISVIYSNYYLFRTLYREYTDIDVKRINDYLEKFGLKGKTEFINGEFTTIKLSDGQRRRLALLVALLEDKDIYVFDEWAADQDPEHKKLFYTEILPSIRALNKLVIVITHDDRYFNCADEVVFMNEGKVVCTDQKTNKN